MKNSIALILILIIIALLVPVNKALAIFLPFGGKVLSITVPGVVCVGEGPISIRPVGLAPFGFYSATAVTKRHLNYVITPGVWIIGLYELVVLPVCSTTTIPPAPVPAFTIILFGTSLSL